MTLSVALISFNEENNIKTVIDAIKNIADEIIVIDSFSTDNTLMLAKEAGAITFSLPWEGFEKQKNTALSKCTKEWILFLDCDEFVSKQLALEIKSAINCTGISGFVINRKTFYMGKELNYAWQPDKKLRLVKASAFPEWTGGEVHEYLTIKGNTSNLKGEIIHHSYKNFADHMNKTVKYAKLSAETYFKKGKKSDNFKIITRPLLVFIKKLILKRGILDGTRGIISAFSSAFYVYMKYSFLWEMLNAPKHD